MSGLCDAEILIWVAEEKHGMLTRNAEVEKNHVSQVGRRGTKGSHSQKPDRTHITDRLSPPGSQKAKEVLQGGGIQGHTGKSTPFPSLVVIH